MDPAIIVVHGAWHTPQHYKLLISSLQTAGFKNIHCPRLPSAVDSLPFPSTATLAHDTQTIHGLIQSLADAGHPIILVMHSYGGVVGSNAIRDLLWPQRQAVGKTGGVVHLVYTAAFIIPARTSMSTPFKDGLIPWLEEDDATGNLTMMDPRTSFLGDVEDDAEAEAWLSMCVLCPVGIIKDETSCDALGIVAKGVDATYLVCTDDYRLTVEAQQGMASLLGEGRVMESCAAGHNPMITIPEKAAGIVREAWTRSERRLKA